MQNWNLDYDGIPWYNNNAKHAIKGFAYYREVINGKLNEKGLVDYLVLLSIYRSCKYKGVSFLKFLLSGERDLDDYCKHPRKRRQRTEIETSALERGLFSGKR